MLDLWTKYAPDLRHSVIDWFTGSPLDTERTFPNMKEGDLLIGAFTNGQVGHDRPFPGAGHYRGHIKGLYLCGSSSHPGGNITGLPGYNCAQVLFSDLSIPAPWAPEPVLEKLKNSDMKQPWHTMHSQPVPGISVMIAILFIVSSNTQGQPLKPDFTLGDLYAALTLNPALRENSGGEPFAWYATNNGDLFVKAFRVWRDTAWLNRGIAYYEFLRSHMHAGPDGYIGLIGPPIHDYGLWNNEVISDALVANLMLEFSELVMNDAMLKKTYANKARNMSLSARST